MKKVQALFNIPDDKEMFDKLIQNEILPTLYQIPYIEKIELTPFYDTPFEVQSQFIEKPIYYQIALYFKELEDITIAFNNTKAGKKISNLVINTFKEQLTSAIGDVRIFYKADIERLQHSDLFSNHSTS